MLRDLTADERKKVTLLGELAVGDAVKVTSRVQTRGGKKSTVIVTVDSYGEDGRHIEVSGPTTEPLVDSLCTFLRKMGIRKRYKAKRKEAEVHAKQTQR